MKKSSRAFGSQATPYHDTTFMRWAFQNKQSTLRFFSIAQAAIASLKLP